MAAFTFERISTQLAQALAPRPTPIVLVFKHLSRSYTVKVDPISRQQFVGLSADLFRAVDQRSYELTGKGIDGEIRVVDGPSYRVPLAAPNDFPPDLYAHPESTTYRVLDIEPRSIDG